MSKRALQSLEYYLRQAIDDANLQTDAHLLHQFIEANDHRAFEVLLNRHGPMVLGTAQRLVHNPSDAEDVFQATFLSFARLAKSIRRGQTIPNWLYTTTCRIAARLRSRRTIAIDHTPEPMAEGSIDGDLQWREVQTALDEELQQLPERLRSPLLLCYLSGLTRDEAAQQLGWSLGTLKRRLEEGRATLRVRLENRGISSAGLVLAILSPTALQATIRPELSQSCIDAVSGNIVPVGPSTLLLTPTTFKSIAMKTAIFSLTLLGLGLGIVSSFGIAQPARLIEEKKANEPPASAKKPEGVDDPLPVGSTMRLGTSRYRQGITIVSMAVSADGKIAYVTNGTVFNRSICAFDLTTGLPLFTLESGEAEAITLSPDEQLFVYKNGLYLYVCDAKSGTKIRTLELPQANPRSETDLLAITPDGKAIATISDGKAVHLIDVKSGKLVRDFMHEGWGARGIVFSPDGKLMAAGGYDKENEIYFARLWEVETGKELRRFVHGKYAYGIKQLAFSPDGKILASGTDDGRLRLFDVDTGKERKVFAKDGYYRTRGVAFSPDGKTIAAAGDSLRLYDVATGKEQLRIDRMASFLRFSKDGKTLIGAVDGTIYRWDAVSGKVLIPDGSDGVARQILVTPDGRRIITNTYAGELGIWDAANGNHLRVLRAGWNQKVIVSPDSRFLAWSIHSDKAYIRLFDLTTNQFVDRFPPLKEGVQILTFTPDNKSLITIDHSYGMVRLWNVETGKEQRSFQAIPAADKNKNNRIRDAAASPDGATLAVIYHPSQTDRIDRLGLGKRIPPNEVRLWDIANGKELRALDGVSSSIPQMAFSPNSRFLAISGYFWDVSTGKRVAEFNEGMEFSAFSADSRLVARASYNGGTISIWETATWTKRTQFKGPFKDISALGFTPNGQILCGGMDTTVMAYDVSLQPTEKSGTLETTWNDLIQRDAGLAFKAQGRLLATPNESIQFLTEKIKPVESANADRLRQLIEDLGNAKFPVREAATKSLSEMGESAKPTLEETIKTSPSPEVIDRVKSILGKMHILTPEQIRQIRAIEVLERIASPDAKNLLKQWATGVKGAVLTEESRTALGRMERMGVKNTRK